MRENEVSGMVVDAAYQIHTALGPGLLESVYEATMVYELKRRGLEVDIQRAIPVVYGGVKLDIGFRADLIVHHLVLVELKSIEEIAPVHKKQLLTYLRLTGLRLGLLLNFNVALIKDGIVRVVNGLHYLFSSSPASPRLCERSSGPGQRTSHRGAETRRRTGLFSLFPRASREFFPCPHPVRPIPTSATSSPDAASTPAVASGRTS